MGHEFSAECTSCHSNFTVSEGGGFSFHLLRCEECGKDKSVGFEQLGEIHLRYLKGLPGPYAVVSTEADKHVRENYKGEPLSEDEYHRAVESSLRKCRCGGRFSFDAPPRCPKCKSVEFTNTGEGVCYD